MRSSHSDSDAANSTASLLPENMVVPGNIPGEPYAPQSAQNLPFSAQDPRDIVSAQTLSDPSVNTNISTRMKAKLNTEAAKERAEAAKDKAQLTFKQLNIRWPVFLISSAIIIIVALAGIIAPDTISAAFGVAVEWAGRYFGSVYILLATAVLLLVILLAISRFGKVRLGPDDSRPQYGLLSWASMLFAAGISTDIMFFAIAEPITQYLSPPDPTQTPPESIQAAREAVTWTMFHYGLHGWGLYALLGMSLAYFTFRRGRNLSLRSTLRPVLGRRAEGVLGHLVDAAAVVGGMFGIATSLGVGVVQLSAGLNVIFGVSAGLSTQAVLLLSGIALACLSALTDISKGLKFLCSANVFLAGVLAFYVLLTGRTRFLLDAMAGNMGDFMRLLPAWSLETYAWNRPDAWLNSWTLFFWAWWITWAAFVGLFLAKISRGRTIRQFVIGSLVIPFSFVLVWVGIMGNSALDVVRGPNSKGAKDFAVLVSNQPELGLFEMLSQRPLGILAVILAVVVGVLFYVTSADSGALVMAELSSEPAPTPLWVDIDPDTPQTPPPPELSVPDAPVSPALRIFWALATGALTFAMLLAGGIPVLQNATVVMALPFAAVIVLVAVGLVRAMYFYEDK